MLFLCYLLCWKYGANSNYFIFHFNISSKELLLLISVWTILLSWRCRNFKHNYSVQGTRSRMIVDLYQWLYQNEYLSDNMLTNGKTDGTALVFNTRLEYVIWKSSNLKWRLHITEFLVTFCDIGATSNHTRLTSSFFGKLSHEKIHCSIF